MRLCGRGGIGIRVGLRSRWAQACGGSNPSARTTREYRKAFSREQNDLWMGPCDKG